MNGTYNFVTMVSALFLVGFAQRIGAKRVHAAALGLAALSLIWLANIHTQYLALVPMIGVGIFWASAVGIPYLMVASMVPAKRTGVYMGILNMMIVVPMLIETVTFGWIFNHLLNNKGSNAMILAGVLLGIGGIAMLWVNPPDEADESPIVPLGSKRSITVCGVDAARKALEKSVTGLTKERARYIEQRLVPGDPAKALLDTVGANPANLIVVGNRGLGAQEGQLLGSVPGNVVKNAVCDVLVVQTSALDEERIFAPDPSARAGADDGRATDQATGRSTGTTSAGTSPTR
jgi:maltose/moltooligosaccharide transporter